jgi:hypothetical protein
VFLVPEAYFDGLGVKVGLSGGERRATFETYTTTTIIMMMAVVAPTAQHRRLINIGNEAGRQLVCVCEGEREREGERGNISTYSKPREDAKKARQYEGKR